MSDAGTMYANAKALHELLQESRAENAELRKERDALDRLTDVLDAANDGLLAENAELRKLVRDVFALADKACDAIPTCCKCPMLGAETCDLTDAFQRMRELGIEVDE